MNSEYRKTILQALVGFPVVCLAFIGGAIVCDSYIPGTATKYLTGSGEIVVGVLIYLICSSLWSIAKWKTVSLYLLSGITFISVPVILFLLCDGIRQLPNIIAYANWTMIRDLWIALRDTSLPVFCAAVSLHLLRAIGRWRHQ